MYRLPAVEDGCDGQTGVTQRSERSERAAIADRTYSVDADIAAPELLEKAIATARVGLARELRRQEVVWQWGTTAGVQWRPARRAAIGDHCGGDLATASAELDDVVVAVADVASSSAEVVASSGGIGRVARCGRYALGGRVVVCRGTFGHYVTGVMRCGSIWSCVGCAPRKREQHRARLEVELRGHQDGGGVVRMGTLTVRHRAGDSLADLLDGLGRAWRWTVTGRRWVVAKKTFGVTGWVRSVDVTVGPSGWHPHLHVLFLLGPEGDERGLARWLRQRWFEGCEKGGLRRPSSRRAVDLRDVGNAAAGYLVGITTEVFRTDRKAGRSGGYAPFQLLDLAGTQMEDWARARWHEYERAVHGRHAFACSRGLLSPGGSSDEPSTLDCEVAWGGDDDPVAMELSQEEWAALLSSRTAVANLLALLDGGLSDRADRLRRALKAR